jgi:large subunit ribosomal protein L24
MLSRIKKDDLVAVISGKDRGKQGNVIAIDCRKELVKVRGVAIVKKHIKARSGKEQSRISNEERFIPLCKVMPVCPKTGKPCRVRVATSDAGKRIRVSQRSGTEL